MASTQQGKEAGGGLAISLSHLSVAVIKCHKKATYKRKGLLGASGSRELSATIPMESPGTRAETAQNATRQTAIREQNEQLNMA